MLNLLADQSEVVPVEMGAGAFLAVFMVLAACFSGISLWLRWLIPLFRGNIAREPICFRVSQESATKVMPPVAPVLLAGVYIALQFFAALKSEFEPQVHFELNFNSLVGNAVVQLGMGIFFLFLWMVSLDRKKTLDYFRVTNWKSEVQAGLELMLLVMPCTMLLGIISSSLWKTPDETHPLLLLLRDGGFELQIMIGISAVLIAPLIEELLFRVLLYNGLVNSGNLSRVSAWITVSVCFSLVHGFTDALQLFPLSLALGWCMVRRQSYLAVVVAHALFNGLMLLLTLLAPGL